MTTIGKEIRKARIDSGLLQKDIAKALGSPQQHLSGIECDIVDPRFSTLRRIAFQIGIPLWKLVRAVEESVEEVHVD
jgi:transcriptional regulator with XRE-family HTH domain